MGVPPPNNGDFILQLRSVLISIDQDGNYECTVEEPLELDAMPLDDLLTDGEK